MLQLILSLLIVFAPFIIFVIFVLVSVIRQINQYQNGVLLQFGKFSSILKPGWRIILPVIHKLIIVDMRLKAMDVDSQEAITKDNISLQVDAVIYFKVEDAAKSVIEVQNPNHAVSQLAQTTMRNMVGEVSLDDLLAKREDISKRIQETVEAATDEWGINVQNVELKDIVLSSDLKRTMAKVAEAERERRATILKSEGEAIAAVNLAKAAAIMSDTPGALHLRTLNSLNDISSDQSNTIVFTVPLEILSAFSSMSKYMNKKTESSEPNTSSPVTSPVQNSTAPVQNSTAPVQTYSSISE